MANNRLWAVCKLDHRAHVVMKYYPSGWYISHSHDECGWFEKHGHEESREADHMGGSHIVFIRETDHDRIKEWNYDNYGNTSIFLKE